MAASDSDVDLSGDTTEKNSLVRRRRVLKSMLLVASGVAAGGMTSPLWIKSPQQLAADAQPPAPSLLTASVQRRVLRDVVVLRGEIGVSQTFDATPATREGAGVVTALKVRRGDTVQAGAVVLEVSGRPLIVLPGEIPAYRDLKPGATGKDVAQLQAALTDLGHEPYEHNGTFGPGTKAALVDLYDGLGYIPLPVNEGDEKRLDDVRRQETAAERRVADAEETVTRLASDPLATEEQKAAADKALGRAREDLAATKNDLAELIRVTGATLPQSEYVFLPRFPANVVATKASIGAPVAAPLVTFAIGDTIVKATLTSAQRPLCKVGAPAEIFGDSSLRATGAVASIGTLEQSTGGPATGPTTSGYPMVVAPSSPLDAALTGQTVRLSIEVSVTDGEQLVVPVSAVYSTADGRAYVTRRAGGIDERVKVELGLSAEGYVVVVVRTGELQPGDVVVVGTSA